VKRLLASAAIIATAAIGVPIATAASASASAPSGGQLDRAWTNICNTLNKNTGGFTGVTIDHPAGEDDYGCFLNFVTPQPEGFQLFTPGLMALCAAMGGTYEGVLSSEGVVWVQGCTVQH
jgi:hypothetical protein